MCWVRQGQMLVVLKRFIKGSDCELDIIFVSHGTHGRYKCHADSYIELTLFIIE